MENEIEQKRRVYWVCKTASQALLKRGFAFAEDKTAEIYRRAEPGRVEFVAGSRYLQRGRYCPSVVRDLYLGNASRWRLLRRITKKTKYSHKYTFAPDGKMLIAETVTSETGKKNSEYLIYEGSTVLGFTFDDGGTLVTLSAEEYTEGKLQSYFCASCFINKKEQLDFGITQMLYEEYTHDEVGFADVTIYNVSPYIEDPSCDDEIAELISYYKYHFIRENNLLIGGQPANSNSKLYFSIPKHVMTGISILA